MNILKLRPLDVWKTSAGLCTICGIPLGLEADGKMMRESDAILETNNDDNEPNDEIVLLKEEEEGQYLENEVLEENFVRVSLFKYNLLGKMEKCHILDSYTFLKPKEAIKFKKALQENRDIVHAMGGDLIHDAFQDMAYEKASDYCQRVAAKRVVPGCRACNATMNRSNAHADIVYRCFPPTAKLFVPELEDSTSKTGKVISKGNVIKKLIQQVALYYEPCYQDDKITQWRVKDEHLIMQDAALWRCVVNLCLWGKSGTVRFVLVAIFYGAVYMYEKLRLAELMLFSDWHLHVFRNFYMANYSREGGGSASWFGMAHQDAAIKFDTTRKNGIKWCEHITSFYLDPASEGVQSYFQSQVSLIKISQFKDMLLTHVVDEKTLFLFLSKKCGAKEAIQTLMQFFLMNFDNARSTLLHARAQRFMREIRPLISREMMLTGNNLVATTSRKQKMIEKEKKKELVKDHDHDDDPEEGDGTAAG